MSTPQLLTSRLLIRPAILPDAAALAALFQNPRNTQHEPHTPDAPTTGEFKSRIKTWTAQREASTSCFLVILKIRDEPDDEPDDESTDVSSAGSSTAPKLIGMGGINQMLVAEDGKRVADMGVLIDSNEWRRGLGREALSAMVGWAFSGDDGDGQGAGCEAVMMETRVENKGFEALVRGLGLEGTRVVKGHEAVYRFDKRAWEEAKGARVGFWRRPKIDS